MVDLCNFIDNIDNINIIEFWIQSIIDSTCIQPHLLISGPTGSGKTQLISLLMNKYKEQIYPLYCNKLEYSRILSIKKGIDTPWNVEDYLNGLSNKKVIIIWDNIDISSKFNKVFYKNPNIVPVISIINDESFRQWKSNCNNYVKIIRPSVKYLQEYLSNKYNNYTSSQISTCIHQNNCDIRGINKQLDELKLVSKDIGTDKWIRDPYLDLNEIISKTYDGFRKIKKLCQWQLNIIETDRYNCVYFMHENFPLWTNKIEISNREYITENMSVTDLFMSNREIQVDYISIVGVVGSILYLDKMFKKFKVCKVISRRNQTIIHENRFRKLKRKYNLMNYDNIDIYLASKILENKGSNDKDINWLSRQFNNGNF